VFQILSLEEADTAFRLPDYQCFKFYHWRKQILQFPYEVKWPHLVAVRYVTPLNERTEGEALVIWLHHHSTL